MTTSFLHKRNQLLILLLSCVVLIWLGIGLAKPIHLVTVDIGRHIANGEVLLSGQWAVLHENYYSYTHPHYLFVNHHWLFGVISFWLYHAVGFEGLSLFYLLAIVIAVALVMAAAFQRGHKEMALLMAFLSVPLIISRTEIRPEGISLLGMGVYYYILTRLSLGKFSFAVACAVLLFLQVLWVNTHIFFFMGPVLVLIFLWDGHMRKCCVCVRHLRVLLILSIAVNFINPSGLTGMLTPLNIFKGFTYELAENQNILKIMKFFPENRLYPYFLAVSAFSIAGMVLGCLACGWRKNIAFLVLFLFSLAAAMKGIRLIPAFALLMIPLGAMFFSQAESRLSIRTQKVLRIWVLAVLAAVSLALMTQLPKARPQIGLIPGFEGSAAFFKSNGLKGPIFSNYDIGGYLIFHFHQQEKVFVDNRQEAFPKEFMQDVYRKMQTDPVLWERMLEQYGFNVIYFHRNDLTEWGQQFLIDRIRDPQWAPVFVDLSTIIFVRRVPQNQQLISRYELPKSMFSVSRPQAQ